METVTDPVTVALKRVSAAFDILSAVCALWALDKMCGSPVTGYLGKAWEQWKTRTARAAAQLQIQREMEFEVWMAVQEIERETT